MQRVRMMLAVGLVILAGGCGITGHWTVTRVTGDDADGGFEITSLRLDDDGRYAAERRTAEAAVVDRGKYDYDRESHLLTLRPTDGPAFSYLAHLTSWGHRLRIEPLEDDNWEATLRRR